MSSNRNCGDIKSMLDSLRADVGDSEFGYRMQAFFAHVLLELGDTITEINQKGHPDIKAVKGGQTKLFQVKSITHNYAGWVLGVSPDDIAGIRPSGLDELGYFAILDCAIPVSWVLNDYSSIRRHEASSVGIETIRASADSNLSEESTMAFTELLTRHKEDLHLLTFAILRDRAIRAERL